MLAFNFGFKTFTLVVNSEQTKIPIEPHVDGRKNYYIYKCEEPIRRID